MSNYKRVDRGSGPRAGQLLQHADDPRRWQVRAFVGRDEHGRKRYRTQVVHGGKRIAEAALLEMLQHKSTGNLTSRSRLTLRDLVSEWLEHKARDVSPRTLTGYRASLENHVLPSLGRRKFSDIQLRDVDHLYGLMLAGELPKPDGERGVTGRPLGGRTVRLAHAALSQALSQAVRWGMIHHNPAAEATIPSHRPREKQPLTGSERVRFLDACRNSFYGAFYRTLVDTGLRPGEACALKWTDLDFARGTISVQRTVTRGEHGQAILAEPKTAKSRRTVPMLGGLREELLRHHDWQRDRNLDAEGNVFTNQDGRMLRPWTFSTRDFDRTVRRAGITRSLTLYSLRHTFATLHVAAGTPLKVVSDVLGHSTIQQTANTYMHGDQAVTADWMQRFERALIAAEVAARAPAN
ncbi:site-specific integrase [soil metagenome]